MVYILYLELYSFKIILFLTIKKILMSNIINSIFSLLKKCTFGFIDKIIFTIFSMKKK